MRWLNIGYDTGSMQSASRVGATKTLFLYRPIMLKNSCVARSDDESLRGAKEMNTYNYYSISQYCIRGCDITQHSRYSLSA